MNQCTSYANKVKRKKAIFMQSYDLNETANRYTKALFLVSTNNKCISVINTNFSSFIDVIRNVPDLKKIIESPLVKISKKKECLAKVCAKLKYHNDFIGFLMTITNHGKLAIIEKVYDRFSEFLNKKNGITKVKIITADPLDNKLESLLVKGLSKKLGGNIDLNKNIDKDIIGGIIIQIKSIMIDHSIRSELLNFNSSMKG